MSTLQSKAAKRRHGTDTKAPKKTKVRELKVNGEINGMITRDKQELISKEQIEMDTMEVSVEAQVITRMAWYGYSVCGPVIQIYMTHRSRIVDLRIVQFMDIFK